MNIGDLISKTILFGLGALSVTKEKAEELVDMLVKKGEVTREEAQNIVDDFVKKGKQEREMFQDTIRNELDKVMNEVNLATKEDLTKLEEKIDELKRLLESR